MAPTLPFREALTGNEGIASGASVDTKIILSQFASVTVIGSSGPVFSFPPTHHPSPPGPLHSSGLDFGKLTLWFTRFTDSPTSHNPKRVSARHRHSLIVTFPIIARCLPTSYPHRTALRTLLPPHSQKHHDGDPHRLDPLAEMATKSFSESWAYYSPYHPAASFEDSTREGCVVSQVNIVSPQFPYAVPDGTHLVDAYPTF